MVDVNEYFDGKVKSIGFAGTDLPATVGVMEPGDYEFSTSKKEVMTVIDGALTVKLPGSDDWVTYGKGESFDVGANVSFGVKVETETAYHCTYE